MRDRARASRALTALVLCAAAAPVSAATILGTVYQNGQPLAQQPVVLSCGSTTASGQTDGRGGYRLSVNAAGNCELRVGPARTAVVLFNQAPTQYDFELQGSGSAAQLRRR